MRYTCKITAINCNSLHKSAFYEIHWYIRITFLLSYHKPQPIARGYNDVIYMYVDVYLVLILNYDVYVYSFNECIFLYV